MFNPSRPTWYLTAFLGLVAGSTHAEAQPTFMSQVAVSGPGCLVGDNDFTGALVSRVCSSATAEARASAGAAARATHGEMGVKVFAWTTGHIELAQAFAQASIGDDFVVSGLDGNGYLRFHFSIVGTGPKTEVIGPPDRQPVADLGLHLLNTGAVFPVAPGSYFINVPVVPGSNSIAFALVTSARCRSVEGSCMSFADFLHTATITGVSVLDATGTPAPDANWSAASGHAYSGRSTARCEVQLNGGLFLDGNTVRLERLRLVNPTTQSVAIEGKIWLEAPNQPPFSLARFGSDGSVNLPAGFDASAPPAPLFTIVPQFPRGTYAVGCRLLNPVSGEVIITDIRPFIVQ